MRVDDFKAKLRGGGARPNLFKVILNSPPFGTLDNELTSFLCEAAQLPGSTISEIMLPFRGRQLRVAGDLSFEPWNVTIINDTDFGIRNSFERWVNGINGHEVISGVSEPIAMESDLRVQQLNKSNDVIKEYQLRGCFPLTVAPIDLSYASENEVERFEVSFSIQYWTSDTTT